MNAALNTRPDLILLDIMLPQINGYEIGRLIRDEGLDMPIIMLTAKGQEQDRCLAGEQQDEKIAAGSVSYPILL